MRMLGLDLASTYFALSRFTSVAVAAGFLGFAGGGSGSSNKRVQTDACAGFAWSTMAGGRC
jgi:hypothetical protein